MPNSLLDALFLVFSGLPADLESYLKVSEKTGHVTILPSDDWGDRVIVRPPFTFVEAKLLLTLVISAYNYGLSETGIN